MRLAGGIARVLRLVASIPGLRAIGAVAVIGATVWVASAGAAPNGSGDRARALAEARGLLARVVLPSGSERLARAPASVQALSDPFLILLIPQRRTVDERGWWRTREAPSDVLAFVDGHAQGRGATCGPSAMRVAGVGSVRWVQCSLPAVPGVFTLRSLSFEARHVAGETVVRVVAVVAWGLPPSETTGSSGPTSQQRR